MESARNVPLTTKQNITIYSNNTLTLHFKGASMTVDNYLAELGALAGLAGIMAGFSLAAVIQLLTASNGGKLVTAGIVVFAAASVMFLYSLIVSILSLSAAAELAQVPTKLDNLNTWS